MLAAYYGAGLGWGKGYQERAEEIFRGSLSREPARGLGWFPTPPELAKGVVDALAARQGLKGAGLKILEPSAGEGALLQALKERMSPDAYASCLMTAVEIDSGRAQSLESQGLADQVFCGDFLSLASQLCRYDVILMNPPFDRRRDAAHVHQALQLLAPGGILVAITSSGARYGQDARAKALRKHLEEGAYAVDWRDHQGPQFMGTNVLTSQLAVRRLKRVE